jgi:CPA2 family monovalent cation:H+ antiporter-2
VLITLIVNAGGGWLIALINRMSPRYGLNIGLILQNRGEFALILATLATGAGLDPRLTPFAGLYVLVMSIIGPVLTVNSERISGLFFRGRRRREDAAAAVAGASAASAADEAIALMEGADGGQQSSQGDDIEDEDDTPLLGAEQRVSTASDPADLANADDSDLGDRDTRDLADLILDPTIQQAMEQSDQQASRKRDPEY